MLKLMWCVFLRPFVRHPLALTMTILGTAIGTSLVYAIFVANYKAVKAIEDKQGKSSLDALPFEIEDPQYFKVTDYSLIPDCNELVPYEWRCVFIAEDYVSFEGKSIPGYKRFFVAGDMSHMVLPFVSEDLESVRQDDPLLAEVFEQDYPALDKMSRTLVLPLSKNWDITTMQKWLIVWASQNNPSLEQNNRLKAFVDKYNLSAFYPDEQAEENLAITASYRFNLNVLAFISAIVAGLFLWNIASTQTYELAQKCATLKSLGCSRKRIWSLLTIEQVLVGSIGALLGIFLGTYLEALVSANVFSTLNTIYNQQIDGGSAYSTLLALGVFGFGVGIYLLASQFSNRVILNTPPSALKQTSTYVRLSGRSLAYALSVLAVIVVTFFLPPMGRGVLAPIFGYIGATLIFVFVRFMSEPFTSFILSVVYKTIDVFKLPMPFLRISALRLKTQSVHNQAMLTTLVGAAVFAGAILLLVSNFRQSLQLWLNHLFTAEHIIQPDKTSQEFIDLGFIESLTQDSGVVGYDCQMTVEGVYEGKRIKVIGSRYYKRPNLGYAYVKRQTASDKELNGLSDGVFVTESFAYKNQLGLGETLNFRLKDSTISTRIEAIVQDYSSEAGYVLMSHNKFKDIYGVEGCHAARLYGGGKALDEKLSKVPGLTFLSSAQLRAGVMEDFETTFAVTDVLKYLSIILGAIALIVKIAQSTKWYLTQWLSLRRLGMAWGDLGRLAFYDSLLLLGTAFWLAFLATVLLGALVVIVINSYAFGWVVDFNLGQSIVDIFRFLLTVFIPLSFIAALASFVVIRPKKMKGVVYE